jgi:integrase
MARSRGRPRGHPVNHHLTLKNGAYEFRLRNVRRSTGCPKSEAATARRIRDKWLADFAARKAGVEDLPEPVSIGKLIALYLAAESNTYDREKGGKQDGAKRDSQADRGIVARLRAAGLDFELPADRLDAEMISDLGQSLVRMGFAGLTRRNTFRLLACIYGWGRRNRRKTGVLANPFDDLEKQERPRIFPGNVEHEAPPFTREQLRAVLDLLPAHASRPVRFAAHAAMRWGSDLLRMTWGRVDFKRHVYTVDPRWAKRGKARDVPLADVALSILRAIRPANPAADDPVWLGSTGKPLRDVRKAYHRAVETVCPAPRPG